MNHIPGACWIASSNSFSFSLCRSLYSEKVLISWIRLHVDLSTYSRILLQSEDDTCQIILWLFCNFFHLFLFIFVEMNIQKISTNSCQTCTMKTFFFRDVVYIPLNRMTMTVFIGHLPNGIPFCTCLHIAKCLQQQWRAEIWFQPAPIMSVSLQFKPTHNVWWLNKSELWIQLKESSYYLRKSAIEYIAANWTFSHII